MKNEEPTNGSHSVGSGEGGDVDLPRDPLPPGLIGSPQIKQVVKALAKAKGQFSIVSKNEVNPFYKSKYADLAAIEHTIAPVLAENELFIMQPANPHQTVLGVVITITTTIWHSSGEFLSTAADVPYMSSQRGTKPGTPTQPVPIDIHGMGSLITYFRRYLKLAFLDIITEDDDGNKAQPRPKPAGKPATQRAPTVTAVQINQLLNQGRALGLPDQAILNYVISLDSKIRILQDLPAHLFESVLNNLPQLAMQVLNSDVPF